MLSTLANNCLINPEVNVAHEITDLRLSHIMTLTLYDNCHQSHVTTQ